MDPLSLLRPIRKSSDAGIFSYTAGRAWCTWNGAHGGALMGALIGSMEQLAGKPAVAATAQFVKGVKEGDEVTLTAEIIAASATVTQARVSATQAGNLIVSAVGTLGSLGTEASSAKVFPQVRSPDASPARTYLRAPLDGDVAETLDVRIADTGATRACLWVRCPSGNGQPLSAALLAAIADHPPFAVKLALGGDWYGISLDASLRVVTPPEKFDAGLWVLLEIVFDAIASPFAFATANVWSADGVLLAVSPQSMRIRHGASPTKR